MLRSLVEHAFAKLGLGRLVARIKAGNVGSLKAFQRAGFRIVEDGDSMTLSKASSTHMDGSLRQEPGAEDPIASSCRLEELWRGSFGREYTDRNADAGEKRARFWRNILSEFPVSSVLEVGCNLGANLRWATLRGADLCGADLREADLHGGNLWWTDFHGADLRGANLREADLRKASLIGANLTGANLHGANLCEADLRGADLRGANLRWADLSGSNLDYSTRPQAACSGRGGV